MLFRCRAATCSQGCCPLASNRTHARAHTPLHDQHLRNLANSQQFVNNLNEYYMNGHDDIPSEYRYPELPDDNLPSRQIDKHMVFNLIYTIKTKQATHSDDFPSWVSRNSSCTIWKTKDHTTNSILRSGIYPKLWKRAELTQSKKRTTKNSTNAPTLPNTI